MTPINQIKSKDVLEKKNFHLKDLLGLDQCGFRKRRQAFL